MTGIGLVVAEDLRGHIDRGEFVPDGDFILEVRAPKNRPAIGWLSKSFCIVQKRIRSPRKLHAVYISIHAHERHFTEAFRKLQIRGKLRKVESRSQTCRGDHRGDVTR